MHEEPAPGARERIVQWHFGRYAHPIYREQLHAVPPGWVYRTEHPDMQRQAAGTKLISEQGERLRWLKSRAEPVALRVLSKAGYVHHTRAAVKDRTALVHSAERLIWRSAVPYVVDFEHAELFVLYQRAALRRPWARQLLEAALLDSRLRFVLAWSDAARQSLLHVARPDARKAIEAKLRVVPPAIRPAVKAPVVRRGEPLRALFVGTKFIEKGGAEAVAALAEARRHADVELDLVSFVPDTWQRRLEHLEGLRVHAPRGRDFIEALYRRSHVLLFPSHMDTFGWVVCEAMAHALPVLAPGHLALRETVRDEHNGLLFEPERMLYRADTSCAFPHVLPPPRRYLRALESPSDDYVQSIASALVRLADDPDLRERLAHGALSDVRDGPLSIPRRQALLADVYEQALR